MLTLQRSGKVSMTVVGTEVPDTSRRGEIRVALTVMVVYGHLPHDWTRRFWDPYVFVEP